VNATLDAALAYANRGLPVFPLNPNSKEPHGLLAPNGFKNATTNPDTIKGWFTEFPAANLAIAIPDGLIVVDIDPRNNGAETWQKLSTGRTVNTLTSISGRGDGGFHLWLNRPADITLNTKLGPGVDVKAGGKGYIVAPPSLHPDSGLPYTWADQGDTTNPPEWLVDALTKQEPAKSPDPLAGTTGQTVHPNIPNREDGTTHFGADDVRPGDQFTATTTWEQLLTADGWTPVEQHGTEYRWRRPGKTTGISAVVNHTGTDRLKVFTSSVPGLDDNGTYDRFGYWAATRHNGNHTAAAVDLAGQGYGTGAQPIDLSWIVETGRQIAPQHHSETPDSETTHGWEPIDLAAVLTDGYQPPKPELLTRNDGRGLLYMGRINGLFGESGGGKSFISQKAVADCIQHHANVIVIDLEDHVGSYIARLIAMGCTRQQIQGHLTYISPELALGTHAIAQLVDLCQQLQPTLIVIDSTGEALSIQGVKPNEDDEVARWYRMLPRALANLGPAVLTLDHVPKSDDAPKNYAIGSQRKRAAIDGALYRVEVGVAPVKGKTGRLRLVCAKDRAGNWQHGTTVAEVTIADTATGTQVELSEPSDPNRPTTLMSRVANFLAETCPGAESTRRQIGQNVSGKRDYVTKAIDVLISEGYVTEKERLGRGGGTTITLLKPFDDPVDNSWIDGSVSSVSFRVSFPGTQFADPTDGFCVFCVPHSLRSGTQNTEPADCDTLSAPSEPVSVSRPKNTERPPDDTHTATTTDADLDDYELI
jgi:hypothetical protein